MGTVTHWSQDMERFHADFVSLLDSFTLETLEKDSNPIYGLSADLTLNYLNPAWFTFAAENEGEPAISERFHLGTDIGVAMIGSASARFCRASPPSKGRRFKPYRFPR